MPYSKKTGKIETLQWFQENDKNIKRILDIGVGSGTYAKLIKGNQTCSDAEWIGVEAWAPYIEKFNLKELYSTIINQDVRLLDWNNLGKFDVAIAGDVLEHMTKDEAISLVDNILNNAKVLIISIPIVHMPQDAYEGNPFEIHVKDNWSHEEILATWPSKIKRSYIKSRKAILGVYWLSNEEL